jgi:hypothetical protein
MDGPIISFFLKLESEEHVKKNLREIELEGMDWIHLADVLV